MSLFPAPAALPAPAANGWPAGPHAAAAMPAARPPPAPAAAAAALPAAGLSNETGEYNCFLNVIIQCLWHCPEFRAAVAAWPPHFYRADPVVAALHQLLQAISADLAARRGAVNPNRLREALSALPGQLFKVGCWAGSCAGCGRCVLTR